MKNLFRGVFVAALCFSMYATVCGQNSHSRDTLDLDLTQAIKIALSDNPTIKVANMEIEKANYAKKEVIGNLLPTVNASASYQRAIEKQVVSMGGLDKIGESFGELLQKTIKPEAFLPPSEDPEPTQSGSSEPMKMGTDNTWSAGFSAGLPLINVPLWQSIKLMGEAINEKLEKARASKIEMVSAVTDAYYTILNAQDSYDVLLKSFNTLNENFRISKKSFEQGTASEYDMIQAEVQVRNLQPTLIAAQNGIELAKLQLKVLMGLPTDYPVKASETLANYERDMFEIVSINDVDASLSDNTTIRQLEVATNLLERQLKLQKAQWYPTLSLSAVYQWTSLNDDFDFAQYKVYPYSTVGLTLSFPIFQGGTRYFKQKQAKIAYDEMQYTMENTKRQLATQLQASIDKIRVSVEQISSSKEAAALAEKGITISQKRYEVGAGSSLELISSENALTQARLNYYQSIYNYIIAKNALDKVLGNAYTTYVK